MIDLEEIKANAPEGATHYTIGVLTKNIVYFMHPDDLIYTKNGWIDFHIGKEMLELLKPL